MADKCELWLLDRTYDHSEFSDIRGLMELKKKSGLKISVCLPTLNVASTVGAIIRVFRTELMERYPLVDQLAIIDSRSSDGTAEIAREEGAEVYYDDEIFPFLEPASGKGEALWKSQHVLNGDIIAWIDSDILNPHPRFVYGIVGPLLAYPDINYVKGFYERPILEGEVWKKTGGGRVTELVVRPMFNLFFPELSGLIQPLSGEYAGRRPVLESIPFFTEYGVESGLLIDIYRKYGLNAIAQVDLEIRQHQNQSIEKLAMMSFGVQQALFRRLGDTGKIEIIEEPDTTFRIVRHLYGAREIEKFLINVVERPPILEIKEYREKDRIEDDRGKSK
ncbi:MAG: glucosyl-3-phosphoglycerate synthase [Actinobacteria bacterium]|nr:glucosyl-3-phosphoglycerate synthase [Actinomycetota bacterium]